MADRKILFRSGASLNEASPTADRARVIGLLSGAATVELEQSTGRKLTVGASALDLTGGVNAITSDQTTFNLLNTTATSLNIGGAATAVEIGAATGTTNVNNNLDVDGDVNVDGGDLTASTTTFNLLNSTVTTLNIGGAATAIEIGAATGTTNVNNALDVDGDVNIDGGDLTASTGTFNLLNTTVTTLNVGGAATAVSIGNSAGTVTVNGDLAVNGGDITTTSGTATLFNTTASTVNVGGAATAMSIGNSAGTVTFPGDIAANGGDITTSSTTFNLVNATATTVNFAQAATSLIMGATTGESRIRNNARVLGNLIVEGTTTTVNSTQTLLDDNHLYLNNAYTAVSAETGGLVVNFLPTATNTTVATGGFTAGVASTSNPTVITAGSGTFAAGDFIQISGANNSNNNGLFEVLSHSGTTLTIRGVGVTATVEDFTQNQFTTDTTVAGAIRKVTVSVIRAGTDGIWEQGFGAVTPVTFSDLSTASASGWTDDGTVVRLTTASDNVTIGSASAGGKLFVDGEADEVQLQVQGNASQGSSLAVFETSAAAHLVEITGTGDIILKLAGSSDTTIAYNTSNARNLVFDNIGSGTLAAITPGTSNETDLGTTGLRFKSGWFQGDVTTAGNFVSGATITVNGTTNTISGSASLTIDPTTTLTFELTDNTAGALSIAQGGNTYFSVSTADGSETITLGNATTNPSLSLPGSGNMTIGGDLAVNGGDITSTATTFNLLNATVTTLNLAGAGTAISIGAGTGTTTINNASTVVSGDLAVNGGDLTSSATTFNLLNSTVTTLNVGGAATAVEIGAATGTTSINNSLTVDGNTTLGDATSDTLTFTARLASNLVPNTDNSRSLGLTTLGFSAIWLRNVANSATVNLNASTAGADGALAIGYDPTGRTTVTATNISDAIDQLDAAIVGTGNVIFTASAAITAGTAVRVTGNDSVQMAIATSEAAARVVGIAESAISASATGVVVTAYGALIEAMKFVAGLTLAANDEVFLSAATAGRATNVAPSTSGQVVKKIGVVKDAAAYTGSADDPAEIIFQPEPATLIA